MRAKAPGKVVLSGAYSVLEGAPAIVAAVDRYVTADSTIPGDYLTEEVRAAGLLAPCWFDARELRQGDRKLGLGSSAAILVATLGARQLDECPQLATPELVARVYPSALVAHRIAQGGGSGIDVAASCYGGILRYQRGAETAPIVSLPRLHSLHIEVWSSSAAASTPSMLAAVRAFAERTPSLYRQDLAAQAEAAESTVHAWLEGDTDAVIRGFLAQRHALQRLGSDAKIPIVTREVDSLAEIAEGCSAAVLPAGAGGGDIVLYVGRTPSNFLNDALAQFEHERLPIMLGAQGLHADTTYTKLDPP